MSDNEQIERLIASQDMTNIMLWRLYDVLMLQTRLSDPESAQTLMELHKVGNMLTPTPTWPEIEEEDEDDGES